MSVTFGVTPADDWMRGFVAVHAGRGEIDLTRYPWGASASALVRASAFNEGVRDGRRRRASVEAVAFGVKEHGENL